MSLVPQRKEPRPVGGKKKQKNSVIQSHKGMERAGFAGSHGLDKLFSRYMEGGVKSEIVYSHVVT